MLKRIMASVAVMLMVGARLAMAQANPLAQMVAPYVDDQTLGVLHVDLSRLDIDATEKLLLDAIQATKLDAVDKDDVKTGLRQGLPEIRRWVAEFRKAGGRHVFIVMRFGDLHRSPGLVIAPLEQGGDAKAISALLFSGKTDGPQNSPPDTSAFAYATEVVGTTVLMGTRDIVARAKTIKPVARPHLTDALAAAGDTTFQAILMPTEESRKVMEDAGPDLPPELGGGPVMGITRGFVWGAASVNSAPKASLTIIFQSQDADSAKALLAVLTKATEFLSRNVGINVQPFANVLSMLLPKQEGNRLVTAMDQQQIVAAIDALMPAVVEARSAARRMVSASNIRQILMACIMYTQEHKGQWPDDLQTTTKAVKLPDAVLRNPQQPQAKTPYVYLKPAMPMVASANTIVIHESTEGARKGVNVGFGDGHVEFMTLESFQKRLEEQKKAAK